MTLCTVSAEGAGITFTAMVSDAQDQPNTIDLDWTLNGASVSTQGATSSGTATWSDSSLTFGSYTLVVTATDTDGLNDSAQAIFTVNGIPSAPEISITPDPATTSDDLSANIDVASTDFEGGTISYTYAWYKDGVLSSHTSSEYYIYLHSIYKYTYFYSTRYLNSPFKIEFLLSVGKCGNVQISTMISRNFLTSLTFLLNVNSNTVIWDKYLILQHFDLNAQ